MSYKRITTTKWEQIKKAAAAMAELEAGNRQQIKKQAELEMELAKKYGHEVEKLPKKFEILYISTGEIGQYRRYTEYYKTVSGEYVKPETEYKETEKSFIVYSVRTKTIIKRENIIGFVW